jgi:osmotically inducible protein OsmC
MATERKVEVEWIGGLMDGQGTLMSSTSGLLPEFEFTWDSRNDETEEKTSPEELLAAAHATDFCMQLAHGLIGAGWEPEVITTTAHVSYELGIGITGINIVCQVEVEGIPDDVLRETAERAKATCPISKALAGVEITLELPDLPPPEEEEEYADDEFADDEEYASVEADDES